MQTNRYQPDKDTNFTSTIISKTPTKIVAKIIGLVDNVSVEGELTFHLDADGQFDGWGWDYQPALGSVKIHHDTDRFQIILDCCGECLI